MMGRSFHKAADESASLLGQLLHDRERRNGRCEFDVIDMDCVVWKASTRTLRYFEEKLPGEVVSPAQRRNLGILATFLRVAVVFRVLHDGGVFLVRFDTDCSDTFTDDSPIQVAEVEATPFTFGYGEPVIGNWTRFRALFTGEEWS